MKRAIVVLALAALAAGVTLRAPRAALNLFGDYYENVARAACSNDAAAVRQLVGGGQGNPNQTDDQERTGLHCAAINGNVQIIAILIQAKAKLNVKDPLGNTPLHLAAARDQVEAAELLLAAGAQVDPQNKDGMTPLMIAASRGEAEIVQALLAKGANAAKTDYTGRDAMGWAQIGHSPAVMAALRRARAAR